MPERAIWVGNNGGRGGTIAISRSTSPDRRVPFTRAGCAIHKTHKPTPASSELHHVFPLYMQRAVWSDVDPDRPASAHDKDRVAICGTGHSDVHLAIDAIAEGRPQPRGIGHTEAVLARVAHDRMTAALTGKG